MDLPRRIQPGPGVVTDVVTDVLTDAGTDVGTDVVFNLHLRQRARRQQHHGRSAIQSGGGDVQPVDEGDGVGAHPRHT